VNELDLENYWIMVAGKTASLLSACTELGALVAGCSPDQRQSYREFGHFLGMAFQITDDFIGIWGNEELTGKSAKSDLVEGKKSLPVLYGLQQKGTFYQRWSQGPIQPEEVSVLAKQLAAEGAESYTREAADLLTRQALQALEEARPQGQAGKALQILAHRLLSRAE
jgi:geranylgeranyl diphosphate synthase type I